MKKFVNRMMFGPFIGWKESAATQKRLKTAQVVAIFCAWAESIEDKKRMKHAAETVLKRLKNAALHKTFSAWHAMMHEQAAHRNLLARILLKMQNRLIAGVLLGWMGEVKSLVTHRTALERTLKRMKSKAMVGSFEAWKFMSSEKVHMRGVLGKVLGKLANQAMSAAFEVWRETVEGIVGTKRAFLQAWHEKVDEKKVSGQVMQKVVTRLHMMCVAGAFGSWSQWANDLRTNRHKLSIVLKRLTQQSMTAAFSAWHAFSVDTIHMRVVVNKCVSRILKRALYSSFVGWSALVADQKQMRVTLSRVIVRIHRFEMRIAVNAWRTMHRQRQVIKSRGAARLFSNLLVYFQGWADIVIEIEDGFRAQIDGYTKGISNPRLLKKCMHGWSDETGRSKQVKESALALGFAGSLRAGFVMWESGYRQRKHELWLLKRAGQRLVNQKVIIIMDKWADYTEERKELREKADAAMRAILMQGVRAAFRTWADFCRDAIATRNALVQQQCKTFLRQAESKAFRRWSELCETKRRLKVKMELFVGRGSKTLKDNFFCLWADTVASTKFMKMRMEKAHRYFQKETMKHIRLTFYTWTFSCMGGRALRFASGRKFIRRVATIRARAVIREWKEMHAASKKEKRQQAQLECVVRKILYKQVIVVYNHWHNFYLMRKDLRAQLEVMIGRQVQGKAASSFSRWSMMTKHEKEVRILLARRMARLQTRQVKWAFHHIKNSVAEQKRIQKVQRTCAIRFTKMAMQLAFSKWAQDHKREMIVRRRAVAKTLSGMLYYFDNWAKVVAKLHEERELMLERYEAKMRTPTMRRTFFEWVGAINHAKELYGQAIGIGFAGSLRSAYIIWTAGYRQRMHELYILRRAGQRLVNQKATIIMDKWADFTMERKEMRASAARAVIAIKMRGVKSAFRTWADFWREAVTTRDALMKQQCKVFLRQAEVKVFRRWSELCEDKRQLRYKLEIIMGRCATTLASDMFYTWSDEVNSVKFVKQRMAKAHQYYAREVIKQIRANFRQWVMMTYGARALIEVSGRKFFRRLGIVKQRNALNAWLMNHKEEAAERHKQVLMQRSVKKLFFRLVLMCFESWVDFHNWRKELRQQLKDRIGRQVQGKAASSFSRWSMMTQHEKEVRILLARRMARLNGRIHKWAFLAWAHAQAEQKRLACVQQQCLVRFIKMAMSNAFDFWAKTHKREMIVRRRAVASTLSNIMYYFENWASVCETLHNEREAMLERYYIKFKPQIMKWVFNYWFEEAVHAKETMSSTIALGFSSSLRGAWMMWTDGFRQRKHEMWLLQRAGARLKNQKVMIILDKWCDYTAERKELVSKASSALIAFKMQGVRAAFRTWADCLQETLAVRHALVQAQCKRLLYQSEAKAFVRWAELCEDKRQLRYKLELIMGRSSKMLCKDVFRLWHDACGDNSVLRNRILKAQSCFARSVLKFCKACFTEWATACVSDGKRHEALLRKSVNMISRGVLTSSFGNWAALCARKRRISRVLTNVRMRVAGDLLSLVRMIVVEWGKMVNSSMRLRAMQVAVVRKRLAKLHYGSCFKRWAMFSLKKVQNLLTHIQNSDGTVVRKGFRMWTEYLEGKRKHFDSVRHHVAQLVERQYRWVWNMWVCEHQAVYRRYHTLMCVVENFNKRRLLWNVFVHWRGDFGTQSASNGSLKKLSGGVAQECFEAWAEWQAQQSWVKKLLDMNTRNAGSRTQSTLALRLWHAQKQLAQGGGGGGGGGGSSAEVASLRAANAQLKAEMDGILGFMDTDDAKPKTFAATMHQGSAMASLSAITAFTSAGADAKSRGVGRGLTPEGKAEIIEEKKRVVAHLEKMDRQKAERVARGGSMSPPPTPADATTSAGSGGGGGGGKWGAMRGVPKKSSTGLDIDALRKSVARHEELEVAEGAGAVSPRSVVEDASSFSNLLDSFVK